MTESVLPWVWWAAAAVLVVAEMLTGTFYLLMIAVGLAAAGIAHLLGTSPAVQICTAALLALVLLVVLHRRRMSHARAALVRASAEEPDAVGAMWSAASRDTSMNADGCASPGVDGVSSGAASQLLDIGAEVDVLQWESGNRTRVRYRGTEWHAVAEVASLSLMPGRYRIVGMDGIRLVLRAVVESVPAAVSAAALAPNNASGSFVGQSPATAASASSPQTTPSTQTDTP
ncbi:NfeD family protein [Robbsia andropogonis]|nr:NfeD family protein [Robbsia andropogonis]MCP1117606.1 NfeD family protein [Robbsia andropogonis]MCP1127072.1 NfeD family protein [Robbsia andropogonis]